MRWLDWVGGPWQSGMSLLVMGYLDHTGKRLRKPWSGEERRLTEARSLAAIYWKGDRLIDLIGARLPRRIKDKSHPCDGSVAGIVRCGLVDKWLLMGSWH